MLGSVAKVRDVIVGVTAVTLGGVVGDPEVVKAGQEDQEAYDDDRDGAVGILGAK